MCSSKARTAVASTARIAAITIESPTSKLSSGTAHHQLQQRGCLCPDRRYRQPHRNAQCLTGQGRASAQYLGNLAQERLGHLEQLVDARGRHRGVAAALGDQAQGHIRGILDYRQYGTRSGLRSDP
ncbi:hypothetical protein BGZ93_009501 [Podila epicladia]|nr:hypothetical protein BGZ93_009501 [Podila epicladia]